MKIQVFSDLHLGHEKHHRGELFVPEALCDTVVIAGDQWSNGLEFTGPNSWMERLSNTFENVVIVMGNHDYYGLDWRKAEKIYENGVKKYPNVHLLKNSSVVIDGIRFVGGTLWTDFGRSRFKIPYNNDFRYLNDSVQIFDDGKLLSGKTVLGWHDKTVEFIARELEDKSLPTIVVTHHQPSYKVMHPRYANSNINHLFYSDLDWLIEKHQPVAWIAGHTHDGFNFNIGKTRLICNPRGYVNSYPTENIYFDRAGVYELEIEDVTS